MSKEQERIEIEREYTRIGIRPGDRLPMPRGLNGGSEYVSFLRQVPDGSGLPGFAATMAQRAQGA